MMRENLRRIAYEKERKELGERIEREAEENLKKNAMISTKWPLLYSIDIPQYLRDEVEKQKEKCEGILKIKDILISDIKYKLLKKDEDYIKLLKSQSEEMNAILNGMADQFQRAKATYREEMEEIEKALLTEQNDLIKRNNDIIQNLTSKRNKIEEAYLEKYLLTVNQYQILLNGLRQSNTENYNILRTRLETDIQGLEQHLETMFFTYQLNGEKLEYNYRVLFERDLENQSIIDKQKREVSKLRDILCNLKEKFKDVEKRCQDENTKLTEEYRRLTENFKELQVKFKTFENIELKKFKELWNMKQGEVAEHAWRALNADRVIHEQQLGLEWLPPNKNIFEFDTKPNSDDLKTHLQNSYRKNEAMETDTEWLHDVMNEGNNILILSMICNAAGFLLDETAKVAIESADDDNKDLIKSWEILKALGVRDNISFKALIETLTRNDNIASEINPNVISPDPDADDNESFKFGSEDENLNETDFIISKEDLLERLRLFSQSVNNNDDDTAIASSRKKKSGLPSSIEIMREAKYWESISNVISEKNWSVWKMLQKKLEKYYDLLICRKNISDELSCLKLENMELRKLLNQYLSSKINEELQLSPVIFL